jgi:recombinational DNA repair protein RecR
MRRRITTALRGEVICDECGTAFDQDLCPTCAQRRRRRAGLKVAVETESGRHLWVTVERADDVDGGGWWPTAVRPFDDDGDQSDSEPDGWPW